MKRFVVIVTSLLIIFVFIALNYLIWDREDLLTIRESNQASIDALSRINMSLNEDKNRLEKQVEELDSQVKDQEEKITELEESLQTLQEEADNKLQFILALKSQINTQPLQNLTIDWINALAEKNFPVAYIKNGSNCTFWGEMWSLKVFSDFFDENVESIEPIVRGEEQKPVLEVIPTEKPDWEIKICIEVDVKLAEGVEQEYISQGINIFELTYTYSERIDQWVVISVSSTKVPLEEGEVPADTTAPEEG